MLANQYVKWIAANNLQNGWHFKQLKDRHNAKMLDCKSLIIAGTPLHHN